MARLCDGAIDSEMGVGRRLGATVGWKDGDSVETTTVIDDTLKPA